MTGTSEKSDYSAQVSLKDLIMKLKAWCQYMRSKWKLILCMGILGALLGLAYSFIKKPRYIAELNFALDDNSSGGGALSGALGLASQFGLGMGIDNGGGAFTGDNLIELLKSRSMVEKTLLFAFEINGKKETLAQAYIDFNHLSEQWRNNSQLKNVKYLPGDDRSKYTLQQDSMLGVFYKTILKSNLTVDKLDKKLSIVNVKVNQKMNCFQKYSPKF